VLLFILIHWLLAALGFAVTSWILDGMEVSGGFWGYLWVSAIFGIVSAIIGTILRLLTLPLILLTLGLFSFVINAILLGITDWITDNLTIDDFFWTTIWAAIILAIVTVVLEFVVARLVGRGPAPAT
jgi:putative membrane protein